MGGVQAQWSRGHIDDVAVRSAKSDYDAFEAIGLSEMTGARVLDVGCGNGFNAHLKFAPYAGVAQVVGIDSDATAIERARAACDDARFTWRCVAFEDMARDDAPFDVVYFSHTFQHLACKEAALDKAFSLLAEGGWLVIKTVDDSMKVSCPDPDNVMGRVLDLYERYVRPNMEYTRHTDRCNGAKCAAMLHAAGFSDVRLFIDHAMTLGRSMSERRALFDRMTYFRRATPPQMPASAADEMAWLLSRWEAMFADEGYLFDSPTLAYVARKGAASPDGDVGPCAGESACEGACDAFPWRIDPMREDDLGSVMAIELRSFSDPWAPVAFAMELRHNRDASYRVARDAAGAIRGYIGWWCVGDEALITHVAVDEAYRRGGVGTALVECAKASSARAGAVRMRLTVRAANASARAFYRRAGFVEQGVLGGYYACPADDGVVMELSLAEARPRD